MSQVVAAFERQVTIASNAGTAEIAENCVVLKIYVAPNGSVSAANAAVKQEVKGNAVDVIASEAVSTSTTYLLYDQSTDSGVLPCTTATPVQVVFDSATNGDIFDVVFLCVRG